MYLSQTEHENICVSVEQYLPPEDAIVFAHTLDEMLGHAIRSFGRRDSSFTVTVIEFGDDYPKVSYPWFPAKDIRIRLSVGTLRWAEKQLLHYAFWQLAHECIHLLSPTPGERVTVLEEGIACYFQSEYMRRQYQYEAAKQYLPSFIRAEMLTRQLLTFNADAIRNIRQMEPTISQITADMLMEHCLDLPEESAWALTQRFERGSSEGP